jgi:FlaA1/EpsC-like NDP-sugar epimerase
VQPVLWAPLTAFTVALAAIARLARSGFSTFALDRPNQRSLHQSPAPSFDDLMSGKVAVSQIRHVELDDLLGRDPVVLDTTGLKNWFSGRVVLVSGANQ